MPPPLIGEAAIARRYAGQYHKDAPVPNEATWCGLAPRARTITVVDEERTRLEHCASPPRRALGAEMGLYPRASPVPVEIAVGVDGGDAAKMGVENLRARGEEAFLGEIDHALHRFPLIDRVRHHALETGR